MQAFLEKSGVTIVDRADEYFDNCYAVFFLDLDGLKLEDIEYDLAQPAPELLTREALAPWR